MGGDQYGWGCPDRSRNYGENDGRRGEAKFNATMSTVMTVGNNAHRDGMTDKEIGSESTPTAGVLEDWIFQEIDTLDSQSILGAKGYVRISPTLGNWRT